MAELKQYEACFPSEHINTFVLEMGKVMDIPIDLSELDRKTKNNGMPGEQCVCLFRDPKDDKCLIIADCCNNDILYAIAVRCREINHEKVKSTLLNLLNECRKRYINQGILNDLQDTYLEENNAFNQIKIYHNVDI